MHFAFRKLVTTLCATLFAAPTWAAPLSFEGTLDLILEDIAGVYTGTAPGTAFSGVIDNPGGSGSITGNGITTPFTCCIFAGDPDDGDGLELDNDAVLDTDTADVLNMLFGGSSYSDGQVVDIVDLEGDADSTAGRIEIGLSFLFDSTYYAEDDEPDLFSDRGDALGALFFIAEFDMVESDDPLYSAIGIAKFDDDGGTSVVPLPASLPLLLAALAGLGIWRRRDFA